MIVQLQKLFLTVLAAHTELCIAAFISVFNLLVVPTFLYNRLYMSRQSRGR